jgi:hypothetical protein
MITGIAKIATTPMITIENRLDFRSSALIP